MNKIPVVVRKLILIEGFTLMDVSYTTVILLLPIGNPNYTRNLNKFY